MIWWWYPHDLETSMYDHVQDYDQNDQNDHNQKLLELKINL